MHIHSDHPDLERLAADDEVIAYFGYGSLVNRHTLRTKFLGIRRARIRGWRRFWMPRGAGEPALLSVKPAPGNVIEGVVVYDRADHLPAVDEREAGYDRRPVAPDLVEIERALPAAVPLFVYEASVREPSAADEKAFILQSYLDAVMQGFHALYGDEGVERFVEETEGFSIVARLDRLAPLYPRAVELSAEEIALFDTLLAGRAGLPHPAG